MSTDRKLQCLSDAMQWRMLLDKEEALIARAIEEKWDAELPFDLSYVLSEAKAAEARLKAALDEFDELPF